jgi:hypothetical protein
MPINIEIKFDIVTANSAPSPLFASTANTFDPIKTDGQLAREAVQAAANKWASW